MEITEISCIDFSMKIYRSFKKQCPILWTRFNRETSVAPSSFPPAPLGSVTLGRGLLALPCPPPALVLLPLPLVWWLQWGLCVPACPGTGDAAATCRLLLISLLQPLPEPPLLPVWGRDRLPAALNQYHYPGYYFFFHFYYSSPSALLLPHPTLPSH